MLRRTPATTPWRGPNSSYPELEIETSGAAVARPPLRLVRIAVSRFKRTESFAVIDYEALLQLLQNLSQVTVTPHILTEISNLAGRLHGDRHQGFFEVMASMLADPSSRFVIDEQHRPAKLICAEPEFVLLGLTDAGILHRATRKHYLVLTDDASLTRYLARRYLDFINFRDLQTYYASPLP